MAEIIRMPKLSDTMTEGIIAEWLKKVGDTIKAGDVLAEVETDKATMELESFVDGTLLYIGLEKGQATPVDAIIAVVGAPNEDYKAYITDAQSPQTAAPTPAPTPTPEPQPQPATAAAESTSAPTAAINATLITMPKLTDSMAEGTLVTWLKKVGDSVKVGDLIAEVETDKATMELEAFEDGVLLYIGVEEGQAVPVDTTIAVIGEAGADYKALLNPAAAPAAPAATTAHAPSPVVEVESQTATAPNDDARVKASPLAKKIAEDKGIDLSHIAGSGDGGRIVKRDLDSATPAKTNEAPKPVAAVPAVAQTQPVANAVGDFEDTPISSMRKTIARRLAESKFTAPHFYLTMEINMDKAMALRGPINEASPVKISFNDMVIKASALALRKHPAVNSAWLGDKIRKYNYVNVGVAVAVEDGLLVPVIRDADKKSLSGIAAEVKELAGKAKDKKLQPKEWEGNTFSISNLGMFGIEQFTAIINPPDSCILAVGVIKETVAHKDGQFYATNVMKVTLSCDHRVVDGALGAAFLQTLKQLLENPMAMLV